MGTAIRALMVVVLLGGLALLLFGYWAGAEWGTPRDSAGTTATSGTIDTERARERGAEIAERAAVAAEQLREAADDAGLTAKIKAKMALDDLVKARTIDVTTTHGVTTLSGHVTSTAERERALALARETEGVERVIDRLRIDG
jgi:osmotically-inducible protein OsmY